MRSSEPRGRVYDRRKVRGSVGQGRSDHWSRKAEQSAGDDATRIPNIQSILC